MSKQKGYLFDTHALIFWHNQEEVTKEFIEFFDKQAELGSLYISSVSFWETALLVRSGRVSINDVHLWKNEILENTDIKLIDPTAPEMIDSVLLPAIHKDPFDRVLISQANHRNLSIVTRDRNIRQYEVSAYSTF